MMNPMNGEIGCTLSPVMLISTPLQFDESHELLTVPSGLYQLIVMLASLNSGNGCLRLPFAA